MILLKFKKKYKIFLAIFNSTSNSIMISNRIAKKSITFDNVEITQKRLTEKFKGFTTLHIIKK